jgi:single-strand DNA-binding protein
MPASMNKAILMGNVGQDPEYRSFPNGGRVASFSLATSKRYKDKACQVKDLTEWHRVQVFNEATIKLCEKYVRKGTHLYLEGAIETRKWTTDGVERQSTEITLRPFNGDLRVLSFEKAGDEPAAEEMSVDMGEPLPA